MGAQLKKPPCAYIMKFLYFLGVFASPVLSQLTDLNPFGRCNRKCENELEKYFKSNNATTHCALLFDEDCCDPDGWALPIPQGYVELESANLDRLLGSIVDKPKKRDAESLVVRAGCSLVARTMRSWRSKLRLSTATAVTEP